MIKIRVVNEGHQPLPAYATEQSAGMDLRANLDASVTLRPLKTQCFHHFLILLFYDHPANSVAHTFIYLYTLKR